MFIGRRLHGILAMVCAGLAQGALGGGNDDPLLVMAEVDRLELRAGDGEPQRLEAEAWAGRDLQKLWLKTEVERADGSTEEAEVQLGWSRALAPFWDLRLGVRRDFEPEPGRGWAVVGVKGLAPYLFDVDAALFVGEGGRTGLRLEAEYELALTQRLMLVPELEVNVYGQNDEATGTGSGLSSVELGVRLRYEIRRELAPYIGVSWQRRFGNTADFARDVGEVVDSAQLLIGLHAWF